MKKFSSSAALVISAMFPAIASACTVCDSETGQQVRAGIFDNNFWSTLAVVISPFPVLLIAIAAYHFGIPNFWTRSASRSQPSLPPNAEPSATTSPS